MAEPELSKRLRDALEDVSAFSPTYWWKPATMRKLAAMGLVEEWQPEGRTSKQLPYRLTEAGRAALKRGERNG